MRSAEKGQWEGGRALGGEGQLISLYRIVVFHFKHLTDCSFAMSTQFRHRCVYIPL